MYEWCILKKNTRKTSYLRTRQPTYLSFQTINKYKQTNKQTDKRINGETNKQKPRNKQTDKRTNVKTNKNPMNAVKKAAAHDCMESTHCLNESWLQQKPHWNHFYQYHWWLQLGTGSGSWAAVCKWIQDRFNPDTNQFSLKPNIFTCCLYVPSGTTENRPFLFSGIELSAV